MRLCSLGVGCEEGGTCYAAYAGQPERCGREDEVAPALDALDAAIEPRVNGVDRERYGTWCAHGRHVMVVDPDDASDHPRCVPAEPWPCGECSHEDLLRDQEAEAAAFEAERWREYHRMIGW